MSSSIPPADESSQGPSTPYGRPPVAADELLPPIEPPSARFILQLFVIPALIVAAVVGLWFLVESLARRDAVNVEETVRALRSSNQARFQRAQELADMLRSPQRYPELKTDHELARGLAALLDEMVEEGSDAEAEVNMRYFLAPLLGEFWIDDGLPVLIRTALKDSALDVRRKAVNAIAVLAGNLAARKPPLYLRDESLADALVQLANDQEDLIRSETAFALGAVIGDPRPVEQTLGKPPEPPPPADPRLAVALEELSEDLFTDARLNAALGLAKIENPRAPAALVELFDPESLAASVTGEKRFDEAMTDQAVRSTKAFKRDIIVHNAIAAGGRLLEGEKLSLQDRRQLGEAIGQLLEQAPRIEEPAPLPEEIIDAAARLKRKLEP